MSRAPAVMGLGLDLVEVDAFAQQLGRAGTSMGEGTFTPGEVAAAMETGDPSTPAFARHLASRFAAKEAFTKAWSMCRTGLEPAMAAVHWREIEITSDSWGRPRIVLAGETARQVSETLGPVDISLSLTHEDSIAGAVVVISGRTR